MQINIVFVCGVLGNVFVDVRFCLWFSFGVFLFLFMILAFLWRFFVVLVVVFDVIVCVAWLWWSSWFVVFLSVNHICASSLSSPETWNHKLEKSLLWITFSITFLKLFSIKFFQSLFFDHLCFHYFFFNHHFFEQLFFNRFSNLVFVVFFWVVFFVVRFLFVVFVWCVFILCLWFWLVFGGVFCRFGCDLFCGVVVAFSCEFCVAWLWWSFLVVFVVCGVLSVNHICAPCLSVNHICAPFPSPHLKLETWNQFCESFFDHFPITLFLRSLVFNHSFFCDHSLCAITPFWKMFDKRLKITSRKNTDTNQPPTHTQQNTRTQHIQKNKNNQNLSTSRKKTLSLQKT